MGITAALFKPITDITIQYSHEYSTYSASQSRINWGDLEGLAPFYNNSSHPIVVGGGTGPGDGHDGPYMQTTVLPGGRVDRYHPAWDGLGKLSLTDVDAVDTSRDCIATEPGGYADHYPFGEKISGDDTGIGFTAYDKPFSDNGIYLLPNNYVRGK